MKKIFLTLLTFCALSASAQRILVGDMNDDGVLSIEDITLLTSTILGERDAKYHYCASSHEYVDLGLPSGTLWATCNVGAERPEDYGYYFAWGEVEPKSAYSWSTYKWMKAGYSNWDGCNKYNVDDGVKAGCWYDNGTFVGDNKNELDLEDDAAYVNWGEGWRMPSEAQLTELGTECTWTLTTVNNVFGNKVVGPNGNSLFLPAAGIYDDNSLRFTGSISRYWSRSRCEHYSYSAIILHSEQGGAYWNNFERCPGYSVRPVRVSDSE